MFLRRGPVQGRGRAAQRPHLPLPQLPEGDGLAVLCPRAVRPAGAYRRGRYRALSRRRKRSTGCSARFAARGCFPGGPTVPWSASRWPPSTTATPLHRPSISGSRKRWPGCGSTTVYRNIRRRFPRSDAVLGYRLRRANRGRPLEHLTLRHFGLGSPAPRRHHLPRGRARLCGIQARRQYRLAAWPGQLQSAQAYRSVRDRDSAGPAVAVAFAVPVRLRQAGPGEFPEPEPSPARHGLGGAGRPRHQHRAGDARGVRLPCPALGAGGRRQMDGGQPQKRCSSSISCWRSST